jgi:hypothetical protein
LQDVQTSIAQLNQAVAAIPRTPDGYPKTWGATERPPNLLEQPPVTERDQAFVIAFVHLYQSIESNRRSDGALAKKLVKSCSLPAQLTLFQFKEKDGTNTEV